MPRHGTPGGNLPAPWDRNATPIIESANATINEDAGITVHWQYTVPAGHQARLASVEGALLCLAAATTTTATDRAETRYEIVPSGGSQEEWLAVFMASAAMAAGDRSHLASNPATSLLAGDALRAESLFTGDNGGAGRVRVAMHAYILEYNAG